jgi:chromosomal replication initiator protein
MQATLLDGHLAEELVSKVAVAFDRIRAMYVDRGNRVGPPTPQDIQRVVMEHFDLRLPDMNFKSSPRFSTEPRQIAMFLCRRLAKMTLPQIAETFGKTHATVVHSCRTAMDRMRNEPKFRDTVIEIVHKLGGEREAIMD